ncbi:hypothetical protein ABPG75_012569 [Micractinium tetrahymenae]
MAAEGSQQPEPRIAAAFQELRERYSLLVEENCACCRTCATAECCGLLDEHPSKVGFLYFHGQDLDLVVETGELWLGHAARDGMPDNVPPLVARSVLEDHGFQVSFGCVPWLTPASHVDWNGSTAMRLKVLIPEGPELDYFRGMQEEMWML